MPKLEYFLHCALCNIPLIPNVEEIIFFLIQHQRLLLLTNSGIFSIFQHIGAYSHWEIIHHLKSKEEKKNNNVPQMQRNH